MGETCEALLKIRQQMRYQDEDVLEITHVGQYTALDSGKHRVTYREYDMEDASETDVVLVFDEEEITIQKDGTSHMKMHLHTDGATREGLYQTPYGRLPLSVRATHYEMIEIRGIFLIDLTYHLTLGDQLVGENLLKISILLRKDYGHDHDHS